MAPAFSLTTFLVSLPINFLYWWFVGATFNLLQILHYFLRASIQILGINSIFKTFFKPWKNEYREGLVRFARFMGMFFKSLFLLADLIFLALLVLVEFAIFAAWILIPFIVIWGVYAAIFT